MTDPSRNGPQADTTRRLLEVLLDTPAVEGFLDQAVHLAVDLVTPSASCGITFRQNGAVTTVASSDALATKVDEVQYGSGNGPCLESLRTGRVVLADDLASDDRWGEYRSHALAHGVRSSLSLPLNPSDAAHDPAGDEQSARDEALGALNIYAHEAHAFPGAERQHAELFAGQVAAALTLLLRQTRQTEMHEQLRQAMSSRSVIDQAIGILMAQQRSTASQAFDLLRSASQHRNRKLRDVAADIVVAVTGEPPRTREFRDPV